MAIDINIPSQVKNYANLAAFPATGSLKTIFIAEDTNKTYRWTGSAYVEISASQATAWGAITGTLSSQTDLQTALNAKVTGNTAITGATKTKVTYDSKGLVTAGADATTADIADSTNKRYVTDANLTVIGNTSGTNTGDQTLSGLGGVPTSRTLTINGTTQDLSADRTFTISTGITIGTTAITSGTVGRVLFEGTGNVVQESANLFWDNTNGRLGIGGTPSTFNLDVVGTARVSSNINTSGQYTNVNTNNFTTAPIALRTIGADISGISIYKASFSQTNSIQFLSNDVNNRFSIGQGYIGLSSSIDFNIGRFASSAWTNAFTIFNATGNVSINSATDAGFKLDVNGTARVSGQITTTTANAQFGAIGASTGEFRIDGVNGAAYAFAVYSSNTLRFGVTGYGGVTTNNNSLDLGTNFLNARSARFGTSGANATIDLQSQSGVNPMSLKISNGTTAFFVATSGSVLVNTTTDIASSRFTINSTTQGFLPPRMDTTQKNAIASPSAGLMVYDTTLNLISVYNGTTWITL